MIHHETYTKASSIIDHEHPLLQDFLAQTIESTDNDKTKALKIYYAVRDGWMYSPYQVVFTAEALRASDIMPRTKGHCIDKAILMIALCRAAKIPSRLGLAKVTNHVSTERLEVILQSNELVPHGYVEVYLNQKWIKATPAFNQSLCEKLNVAALEFDGETDSLLQSYNEAGGLFMEYIEDYGHFEDIPIAYMIELARTHYPHVFKNGTGIGDLNFSKE